MTTLLVLVLIAGLIFTAVIGIYNRLVRLRNGTENAWSDIDVQLKRRHDLVPNVVETVKGYASHEQKTLTQVTEARSRAMSAKGPENRAAAEGDLTRVLTNLFALSEAYPQLRANENFLSLQKELSAIEEAIQNARRYYNAIVRDLNVSIETFPSNLIASTFGFDKKEYFELDSTAERSVPAVSFAS